MFFTLFYFVYSLKLFFLRVCGINDIYLHFNYIMVFIVVFFLRNNFRKPKIRKAILKSFLNIRHVSDDAWVQWISFPKWRRKIQFLVYEQEHHSKT